MKSLSLYCSNFKKNFSNSTFVSCYKPGVKKSALLAMMVASVGGLMIGSMGMGILAAQHNWLPEMCKNNLKTITAAGNIAGIVLFILGLKGGTRKEKEIEFEQGKNMESMNKRSFFKNLGNKEEKKEKLPPAAAIAAARPLGDVSNSLEYLYIGKEIYAKHAGDIGVEPRIPDDLVSMLEADCPFFPGKKIKETHMLLLIPKSINEKPFSLDRFLECFSHHNQQAECIRYFEEFETLEKEIKKISSLTVDESYWVLMTREHLPKLPGTIYVEKEKFSTINQYEMPKVLEAVVAGLLSYTVSRISIFDSSYTRCEEATNFDEPEDDARLQDRFVVGEFWTDEHNPCGTLRVDVSYEESVDEGVVGVRRFR